MSDFDYSVPSPSTSPIKSLAQKKPQELGLLDLEIQLLFGDSKEAASLYLPLYEAYLKHRSLLSLPLDVISGDGSASAISREYDNMATSFTSAIMLKFKQLYPDVEFGNLYGREKAPKSLKDKIRDSEIERISALMAVNSDVPQKVDKVSRKIYKTPVKIDSDLLYTLLCQKIFEYATIETKDRTRLESMDLLDYDPETAIKGHYIIELQKLFYNTPTVASLQSAADELLSSTSSLRFSY